MENINFRYFDKPVTDLIKERISIRSYEDTPIEKDIIEKLKTYLNSLKNPYNSKIKYKLINTETYANQKVKLGTYGIISGASSYVVSSIKKDSNCMEALGYELENFILYATSLGLGTCWLGGTFKKGEFAKAINLTEDELLPIILPVGYPSKNKNLLGSAIRFAARSDTRKSWNELFFNNNFETKLTAKEAARYQTPLEMVRLAPSASNKQPWRIVKDGSNYHFYLAPTKGYSKPFSYDIQKIDIGIAMCHFELSAHELGIDGSWKVQPPTAVGTLQDVEYIISWVNR